MVEGARPPLTKHEGRDIPDATRNGDGVLPHVRGRGAVAEPGVGWVSEGCMKGSTLRTGATYCTVKVISGPILARNQIGNQMPQPDKEKRHNAAHERTP